MTSETWNGHQQLRLPKFLCFWWRITSLMMTSLLSLASAPAGTAAGTTGLRVASCRLELFSFQHEPSQRCASRSVCPEKWIRCRWVISDRGLEKLKAPWNEFWRSCTRRTRNEEHIQLIYGWYTADIQLIYSWYTAGLMLQSRDMSRFFIDIDAQTETWCPCTKHHKPCFKPRACCLTNQSLPCKKETTVCPLGSSKSLSWLMIERIMESKYLRNYHSHHGDPHQPSSIVDFQ